MTLHHNPRPDVARNAPPGRLTRIRLSPWIAFFACLAASVYAQDVPKSTGPTEPQPPQSAPAEPLKLSVEQMQKLFVKRVRPVYPALAQQARITGKVGIRLTVGADGSVRNIMLVYGHPMLAPAAIEAAKKSRYRAYTVDSKPVDAEGPVEYDIY
jgi:TonB family protein